MDPPFPCEKSEYLYITKEELEIMGRQSSVEKVYRPGQTWAALFQDHQGERYGIHGAQKGELMGDNTGGAGSEEAPKKQLEEMQYT